MDRAQSQPHLLNLIPEIRDEIYGWVALNDQEEYLEYAGKHDDFLYCFPLDNVRPPALARVCRTIRAEFLSVYFQQTCFRIYLLRCRNKMAFISGHRPEWTTQLETTARDWLASLIDRDELQVTNVQIRAIDQDAQYVGGSLNVRDLPPQNCCKIQFCLDDGWEEPEHAAAIPVSGRENDTQRFLDRLASICAASTNTAIVNWTNAQKLREQTDRHNVPQLGVDADAMSKIDSRGWAIIPVEFIIGEDGRWLLEVLSTPMVASSEPLLLEF